MLLLDLLESELMFDMYTGHNYVGALLYRQYKFVSIEASA